jgi:hypothetical protein
MGASKSNSNSGASRSVSTLGSLTSRSGAGPGSGCSLRTYRTSSQKVVTRGGRSGPTPTSGVRKQARTCHPLPARVFPCDRPIRCVRLGRSVAPIVRTATRQTVVVHRERVTLGRQADHLLFAHDPTACEKVSLHSSSADPGSLGTDRGDHRKRRMCVSCRSHRVRFWGSSFPQRTAGLASAVSWRDRRGGKGHGLHQ